MAAGKVGIVYSEDFQKYDFGPTHPLRPIRLKLTFELMKAAGLLASPVVSNHPPRFATEKELGLFHAADYLAFVRERSESGTGVLDSGDTPAFKGCFGASALAAGASLLAVDLVMSGKVEHAMNISGGLHHAHRDRASGFCIFNDPSVSIAYLREKYAVKRVLYLDIDVHQGDGIMYGFYSDPNLLDIDFHQDPSYIWPGTGFTSETGEGEAAGVKINVPIFPYSDDDAYLDLFRNIVPAAVRKFKPEILLFQCGADGHINDNLGRLKLTTRTYREVARTVQALAREVAGGRLVVFGGGGYNISNVARVWTVVASELARFELPEETPADWRRLYEARRSQDAPKKIESFEEATPNNNNYSTAILEHGEKVLRELKQVTPPLN